MSKYRDLAEQLVFRGENGEYEVLYDAFALVKEIELANSVIVRDKAGFDKTEYDEVNFDVAHLLNKRIRKATVSYIKSGVGDYEMVDLNKATLKFDAPFDFDCAIRYAEFDREPKTKFYEPRRKQLLPVAQAMQRLEERKIRLLGIALPPGAGKALADDTPVFTADGWKRHGDLVVGDRVVGIDGKYKKVLAVHPKVQLDRVVEFSNGEKFVCHENHEWVVENYCDGVLLRRNLETRDIGSRSLQTGVQGKRGHKYTYRLPKREYMCGTHKDLPLDPYSFGAWLGDGANNAARMSVPKKDYVIIQQMIDNGNTVRWQSVHKITGVLYYGFDFKPALQKYGMCHSRRRTEKHIPTDYLTASIEQRLELLAGLLDTDGTLAGSKYTYSTCDVELKNTFVDLLHTFGWRACVRAHDPKTSSSGIVGKKVCYTIGFTPDCRIPCRVPRKQNKEPHPQRKLGYVSVTKTAPQTGNCITVEGGVYLVGKTMLPTHNSTMEEMFIVWSGLRHPELSILLGSHSHSILQGMYEELLRMLDRTGEYLWRDIFPNVDLVGKSAKTLRIDLGRRKRFDTIEMGAVGENLAGKVRASNLLCLDDLVSGTEEATNRVRLEKLWQSYGTDYRQRKISDCVELIVGTPWSLHDPMGKLEALHADDPLAEFIHFPALDENDESNFDYPYGLGYSTEDLHNLREIMDEASFNALYMTRPIEREGVLYGSDELRRYFELPDEEPDAILAVCDTKTTGKDYCVLPIVYQYGTDFYVEDVVCENYAPDVVETSVVNMLCKHNPQMARFESNVAGGKMAQVVQERIKEKGCRTKITTKWTQANKETKIQVESPWVKQHCLFKDDSVLKGDANREYRLMLQQLTSYSMTGKNLHDDVPDAFAQLSQFAQSFGVGKVQVFRRRLF